MTERYAIVRCTDTCIWFLKMCFCQKKKTYPCQRAFSRFDKREQITFHSIYTAEPYLALLYFRDAIRAHKYTIHFNDKTEHFLFLWIFFFFFKTSNGFVTRDRYILRYPAPCILFVCGRLSCYTNVPKLVKTITMRFFENETPPGVCI